MAFKPKDNSLWDVGPCLTYKTTSQAMRDPDENLKFVNKHYSKGLNFRTFRSRIGARKEKEVLSNPLLSTYQIDYLMFLPELEPPPEVPEDNRRYPLPLNVLEFERTNLTKFLDDPLIFPTPARQQIDRVRQKRYATFLNAKLYEPEYDMCCKGKLKELMESNNLKEPLNEFESSKDC